MRVWFGSLSDEYMAYGCCRSRPSRSVADELCPAVLRVWFGSLVFAHNSRNSSTVLQFYFNMLIIVCQQFFSGFYCPPSLFFVHTVFILTAHPPIEALLANFSAFSEISTTRFGRNPRSRNTGQIISRAYSGLDPLPARSIGFQKSLPYANSIASAEILGVGIPDKSSRVPTHDSAVRSGGVVKLSRSPHFNTNSPRRKSSE